MIFAAALLVATATAPPDTAPQDSTLAELLSRDSASHVVLTPRSVDFAFTERGARRVRRASDSAAAARPQRAARSEWFDGAALARGITDGIVRGMHMTFPLELVDQVRADGDMLTVCFASRAPDTPPCGDKKRFVFTGTTPADVHRFAAAVEQARARAAR